MLQDAHWSKALDLLFDSMFFDNTEIFTDVFSENAFCSFSKLVLRMPFILQCDINITSVKLKAKEKITKGVQDLLSGVYKD